MNFKGIKAISFDFDGVFVIDSDAVYKQQAWDIALAEIPNKQRTQLVKEGNERYGNGKPGGRVEILRFALESFGVTEHELPLRLEEAATRFEQHVQACILAEGVAAGALETLHTLKERGFIMYLNSGTASAALRLSAENIGVMPFIKEALGSTKEPHGGSKVENLEYIAAVEQLMSQEILMVGDGEPDKRAAAEFDCPFIGVSNRWNRWDATADFDVVTSLPELLEMLK